MMIMKKGERVHWYLFEDSNEDDAHTPRWHGQTVLFNGMRADIDALRTNDDGRR
jgi:hypothetical protein